MTKITTEVNGEKYEFVKHENGNKCDKCALKKEGCGGFSRRAPKWDWYILCSKLDGVWKEMTNDKNN